MWWLAIALAQSPAPTTLPAPPEPTLCAPWLEVDGGCKARQLRSVSREMGLSTAGLVLQAVAVPIDATAPAIVMGGYGNFAAPFHAPFLVTQGVGTVLSASGQLRMEYALDRQGVHVSPTPRIVGTVLGGTGFALQAVSLLGGISNGDSRTAFGAIGYAGLGLQLGGLVSFGVGHDRLVRTLKAYPLATTPAGRPQVQVAPTIDLSTGTVGITGRF